MPKRYGKLAKIMQKQAVNADAVSAASSAVADASSSSVITSMPPSHGDIAPILQGISARLSDRGDIFSALKKIQYSVDGLTSALLGRKYQSNSANAAGPVDTTEQQNESIKRDEYMISLLEQLVDNTQPKIDKSGTKKEESGSFSIGAITAIGVALAAALGAVVGYIKGYVKLLKSLAEILIPEKWIVSIKNAIAGVQKSIASFMAGVSMQFDLLKASFMEKLNKILAPLEGAFKNVASKFEEFKAMFSGESRIGKAITGFIETFKSWFAPIEDGAKLIKEGATGTSKYMKWFIDLFETVKGFFSKGVEFVSGIATKVGGFFSAVSEWGGTLAKVFKGAMAIFEKIALPLTVIMAVWDTVKGAIEGFEKEGIVGAFSGAIKGLIESLITGPIDMLKGAISWILDAFGFEKAAQFLDSFNLTDMMKGFVDAIFHPIDTVKALFEKLMTTLENIGIPEITLLDNKLTGKVTVGPFYPFKSDSKSSSAAAPSKAGASGVVESKAGPISGGGDGKRASNDPRRLDAPQAGPSQADIKEVENITTAMASDPNAVKQAEPIIKEFYSGKVSKEETIKKLTQLKISPTLNSGKIVPADSSTGSQVASASSEVEMAKSTPAASAPVVIAPQTNVSNNSASTYAIKSPVRNPAPPLPRNPYAVA